MLKKILFLITTCEIKTRKNVEIETRTKMLVKLKFQVSNFESRLKSRF